MKQIWTISNRFNRSQFRVWLCAAGAIVVTLLIIIVFPLTSTTAENSSGKTSQGRDLAYPTEVKNEQVGTQLSQANSSIIQGSRTVITSPPSSQPPSQPVIPSQWNERIFCPQYLDGPLIACRYCGPNHYDCSPCSPRLLGPDIICASD